MFIYLPGNSNIKPKSCVSYPFWMVQLGTDALRIPCTAGDSRKAIGLQQNKFEAWQNEWADMSWPPVITGGGIALSKPLCFTVFHSRCFTADQDWRTALDWNSQHCQKLPMVDQLSSDAMRRSATMAMGHGSRPKIARWIPSIFYTALEKFHVSSKLPIWWISTGRLDYHPKGSIPTRFRTGSGQAPPMLTHSHAKNWNHEAWTSIKSWRFTFSWRFFWHLGLGRRVWLGGSC